MDRCKIYFLFKKSEISFQEEVSEFPLNYENETATNLNHIGTNRRAKATQKFSLILYGNSSLHHFASPLFQIFHLMDQSFPVALQYQLQNNDHQSNLHQWRKASTASRMTKMMIGMSYYAATCRFPE